jgi:hypothetical protein
MVIRSLLRKILGLSPKQAVVVDALAQEGAKKAGKAVLKEAGKLAKKL